MKRVLISFIVFIVIISVLCGCGVNQVSGITDNTEKTEKTKMVPKNSLKKEEEETGRNIDTISLDKIPIIGDRNNGFTVTKVVPCSDLNATIVELEHDKTGAVLIWIANESTDRSFMVSFKTLADNDKGIPHVFEHAVLSGNEKYTNPNLMMAMMNGTFNTSMNGATSETCTVFPVSSLSEDQLLKFVDYYMNGVYHPLVLTDERSLMREAYRYELADHDAELTVQGTVYSEMLGYSSQESSAENELLKQAYPGSRLANQVGGIPEEILKITHDEIIEFHNKFYHPSNSLMILSGDIKLDRFLELIDRDFLSAFEKKETDLSDTNYKHLKEDIKKTVEYPLSENDDAVTVMYFAIPLDELNTEETVILEAAVSAMASENQIFDRTIQKQLPGVNANIGLISLAEKRLLCTTVTGAEEQDADKVIEAIKAGIRATLNQGLNDDILQSLMNSVRYDQAMSLDNQSPIDISMQIATDYSTFGKTDSFLDRLEVIDNIQRYYNEGQFDRLLRKYLSNPGNSVLIISKGVPGLREKKDEEFRQRLVSMKESMSDDEIDELIRKTDVFNKWNADNQKTVSLDDVTVVDVQSLPEEILRFKASEDIVDGMHIVTSEIDSDLIKASIYFDLSTLPAELLDMAAVYYGFLDMLPTARHDSSEIVGLLSKNMTEFDTSLDVIRKDDGSHHLYMVLNFSCFSDQLDDAYASISEVLTEPLDNQSEEFRELCRLYSFDIKKSTNPQNLVKLAAQASYDESSVYKLHFSNAGIGITAEKISVVKDEYLDRLQEKINTVRSYAMNKNGMILTVIGNEENIVKVRERTTAFRERLDSVENPISDHSEFLRLTAKNVAIGYDSSAMYNYVLIPFDYMNEKYSTKFAACAEAVTSEVLIPLLRFENSVYSTSMDVSRDWIGIMAYRDPRLKETFNEVIPSVAGRVRELNLTQDEMNNYISKVYSSIAVPYGPFKGAATAIRDILEGRDTFERIRTGMKDLKATKPDDLKKFADVLDTITREGSKSSVGNIQMINNNSKMFDEIDTRLLKSVE